MATPTALTSSKVALKGTAGNCLSDTNAFLASLGQEAMIACGGDHILALMLPKTLNVRAGAQTLIPYHLLHYLLIRHAILEALVRQSHCLFFVKTARIIQFLRDCLDTGLDTSDAKWPIEARKRFSVAMLALSDVNRTIAHTDINVIAPPTADGWLERITVDRLCGFTDDYRLLVSWQGLIMDALVATKHGEDFTLSLELIVPPGAAASSAHAKSVKVLSHVRTTDPVEDFSEWVSYRDTPDELERRSLPLDQQWTGLYERCYNTTFVELRTAFPGATATELRSYADALAVHLKIPLAKAPIMMGAVCSKIKPLLASIDAISKATAPSSERYDSIVGLIDEWGVTAGSKAKNSLADESHPQEKTDKLMAVPSYCLLYAKVVAQESNDVPPTDRVSMLAKDESGVGVIYMASKRPMQQVGWESMACTRNAALWHNVIEAALHVDADGNAQKGWGKMLPLVAKAGNKPDYWLAKALITGDLTLVTNWYMLAQPWVVECESEAGLPMLASPSHFWLSPDHLDVATTPINYIMAAVGHDQSRSVEGSWREFVHNMTMRSKRLSRLPHDLRATLTLYADCLTTITRLFSDFADRSAAMHTQPLHLVKRPVFLEPGGVAANLFSDIDTEITKLREDVTKAKRGQATHQQANMQSATTDAHQPQPQLQPQPSLQAMSPWTPTVPNTKASSYPTGIYENWGDAAYRNGVFISPQGPVLGNKLITARGGGRVTSDKSMCPASLAENESVIGKGRWCVKGNCTDHEFPSGKSKSDYEYTVLAPDIDRSGWKTLMPQSKDIPRGQRAPKAPPGHIAHAPLLLKWDGDDGGKGKGGGAGKGKGGAKGGGKGGAGAKGGAKGGGKGGAKRSVSWGTDPSKKASLYPHSQDTRLPHALQSKGT